MVVMPIWIVKYLLILGGFAGFFENGDLGMLAVGVFGLLWGIRNWSMHMK